MELLCEKNDCLLNERSILELESGFRSGQYSWRPSQNYSDFWGKTLAEGVSKKLGTFRPQQPVSARVSISLPVPSLLLPRLCPDRTTYLVVCGRRHRWR